MHYMDVHKLKTVVQSRDHQNCISEEENLAILQIVDRSGRQISADDRSNGETMINESVINSAGIHLSQLSASISTTSMSSLKKHHMLVFIYET